MSCLGLLTGSEWRLSSANAIEVVDKYTGEVHATLTASDAAQVDDAIAAASKAFLNEPLVPYQRYEILARASQLVEQRRGEFVSHIIAEGGFTRTEAEGEVSRAVQTLLVSAEEAKRVTGELVPIDGAPGGQGKIALTLRVPVGVVCAITPFNSPLNTPLHKVAPAIAAGNTVVLKPSTLTPVSAVRICEVFQEAGLPPGWLNLVVGSGAVIGAQLLQDERIAFYHFTGSTESGRVVRREAGLRGTALELGSIASTIVCEDGDAELAVGQCVSSAFRKAGQVCTSTQLIYVHHRHYDRFLEEFAARARALVVGDPRNTNTEVGPLISNEAAARVRAWIEQSSEGGGRVIAGGERDGPVVRPCVMTDVGPDAWVVGREVFGPVASVLPFNALDEVVDRCNRSPYGLAIGAFTRDLKTFSKLATELHTGTIHINSTSSSRIDLMPFGGVKDSGNGKEGPRYAIHEMTEERLVVLHNLGG